MKMNVAFHFDLKSAAETYRTHEKLAEVRISTK